MSSSEQLDSSRSSEEVVDEVLTESSDLAEQRIAEQFQERVKRVWFRPEVSPESKPMESTKKLGRYQIERAIGRGGFGIVYLASDPVLQRKVALKVPLLGNLEESRYRERFLSEARAVASLQHRYLMPIYDAGEVDGVGFMAMRYCPMGTLAKWLAEQTCRLSPRSAAALMHAICEGVSHAHDRNIIHRDLKPANILLDTAPSDSHLREFGLSFIPLVTDFGMAKLAGWDDPEAHAQLTRTGTRMGTPSYMSPEQATGRAKESRKSADVYGLGVILFELLSGRPPFTGESDYEVLHQVVSRVPPSLRRIRPEVPKSLEHICLKCLEKDPGRRYADANQLSEDIARFLEGKPIADQPWMKRSASLGLRCAMIFVAVALFVWLVWKVPKSSSLTTARSSIAGNRNVAQITGPALDYETSIRKALPSPSGIVDAAARQWLDHPDFKNAYSDSLGFEWRYARQPGRDDRIWISHSGESWAIAYSPSGNWMAENSNEAHVNLWDAQTETLVKRLPGHRFSNYALSFSGDQRWLAASERHHKLEPNGAIRSIQVWDLNSLENIWPNGLQADLGDLAGLTFAKDSQWIYLYGLDLESRGSIWKCHVETAKVLWKWNSSKGMVHSVAESDQADEILLCQAMAAEGESQLSVLSLRPSSMEVAEILPAIARVGLARLSTVARFSADGSHLVTAEYAADRADQILKLNVFDIRSQQQAAQIEEPGGCLEAFCFERATNNLFFVSASSLESDPIRVVRRWDADRKQTSWIRTLSPGERTNTMTMHPSSETLVLRRFLDARIHYLELNRRHIQELQGHHPKEAWSVDFSEDGQRVLSGGDDGLVRLWDVTSGKMLDEFRGHEPKLVTAVGFVPRDPKRVATGGFDKTIQIWTPFSQERPVLSLSHGALVRKLAFTPDGKSLISIADDFLVRSWNVEDGQLRWQSTTGIRKPRDLCLHPDGSEVAVVGNDGVLRIVATENGMVKATADSSSSEIWSVVYSPREHAWLVGTKAGAIESLPVRGMHLKPWGLSDSGIRALAISSDGQTLVSANMEGEIELWQVSTRKQIGLLDEVQQPVYDLVFSPKSDRLAAALHNGSIRIWNAPEPSASP